MLKEMVRNVRLGGAGGVRGLQVILVQTDHVNLLPQDQIEDDEIMRWAGTLPRARVTRWGGMISTPGK